MTEDKDNLEKKERFTLRKGEKLRHKSLVDSVFTQGNSVYDFPVRATWRFVSNEELSHTFRDRVPDRIDRLQVMLTVPKKKRRHAVDRVLMRRRMREAYRLNRLNLKKKIEAMPGAGTLSLAIVYIHNENLPYKTVESKIRSILRKIEGKLGNV